MNISHINMSQMRHARTPYHSLGDGTETRIPDWAEHRSVFRTAGRTLYLVETAHLAEAAPDLRELDHAGWNVSVEQSDAPLARIALTRRILPEAA